MGLSLKTGQQLSIVGELQVHDFDGVNMIIFQVACNIYGGKAASSSFVDEFVAAFDDATNHVAVHSCELLILFATFSGFIIHHPCCCVMRGCFILYFLHLWM